MFDDGFEFGTSVEDYASTGGGGTGFLRYVEDGATTLRFTQDLKEARVVKFHYDKANKSSFPCPGSEYKNVCPGCTSDDPEVKKAGAKIVITAIADGSDYINVYSLAIGLKEKLERAQDRDGTLQARPYTIYRSGKGLTTSYDLDKEDKYPEITPADELGDAPDVSAVLKEAWNYGTNSDYRDEKKKAAESRKEEGEKPAAKPSTKAKGKEEPPFEAKDEDLPTSDLTESEVRAMPFIALINLAREVGVTIDDDWSKQDIADAVIKKYGV